MFARRNGFVRNLSNAGGAGQRLENLPARNILLPACLSLSLIIHVPDKSVAYRVKITLLLLSTSLARNIGALFVAIYEIVPRMKRGYYNRDHTPNVSRTTFFFPCRHSSRCVLWPELRHLRAPVHTGSLLACINRRYENITDRQAFSNCNHDDRKAWGIGRRKTKQCVVRAIICDECVLLWHSNDNTTTTTQSPHRVVEKAARLRFGCERPWMKEKKDIQRRWLGASILSIEITFWCSSEE